MIDRYKDVVIDETTFRLHRLDAQTGSWIAYEMMMNGGKLPKESFLDVQNQFFSNIQIAKDISGTVVFTPIYVRESKQWADKELEFNLLLVSQLTLESLKYNFDSFFQNSRIKEIMSMVGLQST